MIFDLDAESKYSLACICSTGHIRGVMIETFAALAEPNRLRIVELLRSGPQAVGEISGALHLNQPQVSKHLRVLKDAGLVDVQPLAQQRLYQLRPLPFRALQAWLEEYRMLWDARFTELDGVLADLKKNQEEKSHDRRKKQP